MHSVKIHKVMALIIGFFYLTGFWHRGVTPTAREFKIKSFYCIYYFLVAVSFVVGAITNDEDDQIVFLTEGTIAVVVYAIKLWMLIWKQDQILDLLNRICEFSIRNDKDYALINYKIGRFMKFVVVFVVNLFVGCCVDTIFIPIFNSEKTLFFEIAFPLDWRNSEVAFCVANVFLFTESLLTIVSTCFSVLIWYFLLNCSLRQEVLGSELRNMGRRINENGSVTIVSMRNDFVKDLTASIDAHLHLRDLIKDLESFCSGIFFIQFGTSALCICGSIYCLAFDVGDTILERLLFFLLFIFVIAELFMITYFGNEILLSSNRLSYSLFESDWCDQPQKIKKCIAIFGEYLRQPQELLIGKLYPLTLETFTRILNSAYSMFNILKGTKE